MSKIWWGESKKKSIGVSEWPSGNSDKISIVKSPVDQSTVAAGRKFPLNFLFSIVVLRSKVHIMNAVTVEDSVVNLYSITHTKCLYPWNKQTHSKPTVFFCHE